jgi:hypothetical protein
MSAQRYERVRLSRSLDDLSPPRPLAVHYPHALANIAHEHQVAAHDEDESPLTPTAPRQQYPIPNSPPPSFRSRASSPSSRHHNAESEPLVSDADRTLADTFDSPSDDEESDDEGSDGLDDRQRLMRGNPNGSQESNDSESNAQDDAAPQRQSMPRRITQLPVFTPQPVSSGRVYGGGSNDGVFANLSAKPTRGEQDEEKPPVRTFCRLHRLFVASMRT